MLINRVRIKDGITFEILLTARFPLLFQNNLARCKASFTFFVLVIDWNMIKLLRPLLPSNGCTKTKCNSPFQSLFTKPFSSSHCAYKFRLLCEIGLALLITRMNSHIDLTATDNVEIVTAGSLADHVFIRLVFDLRKLISQLRKDTVR